MDSRMMELLRLSATASLTAFVVLFARLLLARAPRVCSYLLWSVVFFRAVLPVSFTTKRIFPEIGKEKRSEKFLNKKTQKPLTKGGFFYIIQSARGL